MIVKIPRCSLCVFCTIPGEAISPWQRLPFALQLFQRKRPEHFTSFFFVDIIIYFNVGFLLLSNCFIINLKLHNAAQRCCPCWVYQFRFLLLRCRESKEISTLDKCFKGVWVRLELSEPSWWRLTTMKTVSACDQALHLMRQSKPNVMPRSGPGRGGVLGTVGFDWCIRDIERSNREWHAKGDAGATYEERWELTRKFAYHSK